MQRKLLTYLDSYGVQLVVATHSTTVLNTIQNLGGRVFRTHLTNEETGTSIQTDAVSDSADLLSLLKEIGISAADVLQAEKALWVEGPHDIPVFKSWIEKAPSFRNQVVAVISVGGHTAE